MTHPGPDAPQPDGDATGEPGPQPTQPLPTSGHPGAAFPKYQQQHGYPPPRPAPPHAGPPPHLAPPPYGVRQPLRQGPFPSGYPMAYAPAAAPSKPALPGWVWPLLVVAALVTGLLGGLLGGALVLGSSAGDDLLTSQEAAPLEADNGSIAAVAARVLPSTVQVRVVNGKGEDATGATGSGFVIDRRGHVVTNNHVVEVAEGDAVIEVVGVDGAARSAEVVGSSPVYDIAVLRVQDEEGLRPAALGSSRRLQVGETVVAIGAPLGLSATVTSGIVSALDRPVTTGPSGPQANEPSSFINAVQTDAAINPGNSGGPLVNLRGQVVGVNSAIATTGGMLGGEGGNIGVGFAIPMDQVRYTAEQILDTGQAEYPVIGANVNTGDSSAGATILEVQDGTPAAEAGLREGDRIVAVEGKLVPDGVSLIVAIRTHRPGETIELTIIRDGRERAVEIELDAAVG